MGNHSDKWTSITVSRDVYKALEKTKKNGETFNDVVASMVAEKERSKKQESELDWLVRQGPDFLVPYAGKYIAIWKHEIIGVGRHEGEALDAARKKVPDSNPTIMGVPTQEGFIGGFKIAKTANT
ncbi:hypothetical protein Ngar_c03400 [Candidatus Nitrososphaera gargensis Ga9.2]|uniref:DUF5678 domain-containing protein n=1 Tax=Nitrososphaera gargensis (strain Ga9.2) TaxID=1237085 RepID=K0IEP7_NITGG|nr:DUF5678 domain-containing protein [Candidatus Nitrososphaera gargensis]AFU57258.1 hypothetical protein Ngar_c03100 [Candidatus Nitrososphaera gargensis Ga9.2]AFU57288.1 hypothetical protein Ngar_c03400 [Candidatus Nitrososphaera gargensis Ga9.2]